MKDPRSIILAPVVSEKTYALIEDQNIYTFRVDRRTNKTEIKMAVAAVFGVKVVNVNTINRKGKLKRTGAHVGKRKDVKHAMVKLADGESIEIFGA